MFEMTGSPAINRPVVLIVGDGNRSTGIHLSRFWYEQEATIRSISSPIPLPSGFVSSVILGDGRVIPLIDKKRESMPDKGFGLFSCKTGARL